MPAAQSRWHALVHSHLFRVVVVSAVVGLVSGSTVGYAIIDPRINAETRRVVGATTQVLVIRLTRPEAAQMVSKYSTYPGVIEATASNPYGIRLDLNGDETSAQLSHLESLIEGLPIVAYYHVQPGI
jgi:hypothetical protein